jgi:hypothetical protein
MILLSSQFIAPWQDVSLHRNHQPRLEANAGYFRGQAGEKGEFFLYIPSQNRNY